MVSSVRHGLALLFGLVQDLAHWALHIWITGTKEISSEAVVEHGKNRSTAKDSTATGDELPAFFSLQNDDRHVSFQQDISASTMSCK